MCAEHISSDFVELKFSVPFIFVHLNLNSRGAGEVVHQAKAFVTIPGDLSSISRTHVVVGVGAKGLQQVTCLAYLYQLDINLHIAGRKKS